MKKNSEKKQLNLKRADALSRPTIKSQPLFEKKFKKFKIFEQGAKFHAGVYTPHGNSIKKTKFSLTTDDKK